MGLGFVKIGVDAVVCEEGVVGSVFGDAAVVEDHDDIGILDGGQAVRDDEHRAALHQLIHAALDDGLGACVDGRGRLVEDQHGGVAEKDARDGEQLSLADRDVLGIAVERGVVAARQGADEEIRQKNVAAAQEADRQRQERMQRAQADADKLLKNARGAAEQERNAMLEGAKKDIAQMVVSATGKLMDKENDPAFDKALYDSFLKAAQEENDHD